MLPPKYANQNDAHHGKIEGVGGKLLAVLWPPQGRSDDMHGKNVFPMMPLIHAIIQIEISTPGICNVLGLNGELGF